MPIKYISSKVASLQAVLAAVYDSRQVTYRGRDMAGQRIRVHDPRLAARPQASDGQSLFSKVEVVSASEVFRDRTTVSVDQSAAIEPAAVVFWDVFSRWGVMDVMVVGGGCVYLYDRRIASGNGGGR